MGFNLYNRNVCSKYTRLTKRAFNAGDSAAISGSPYALAFSQMDGEAVPAPAQVTQTIGRSSGTMNLKTDRLDLNVSVLGGAFGFFYFLSRLSRNINILAQYRS
jgi:hypothetical protein